MVEGTLPIDCISKEKSTLLQKNNEMDVGSDQYKPWINPKRDNQTAAHQSGSPVKAKGSARKGDDSRVFICNHNHMGNRKLWKQPLRIHTNLLLS